MEEGVEGHQNEHSRHMGPLGGVAWVGQDHGGPESPAGESRVYRAWPLFIVVVPRFPPQ